MQKPDPKPFGHSILGLTFPPESQIPKECSENLAILQSGFASAAEFTTNQLTADLAGRGNYTTLTRCVVPQSESEKNSTTRFESVEARGISVFGDCGLPKVRGYGEFLRTFPASELSSAAHPFVGLQSATAKLLWNPVPVFSPVEVWLGNYSDQLLYLARLNWNDSVWQGGSQERWVKSFGGGLVAYMTELFSGRFQDRNGKKISFDLDLDLTDLSRLDQIQVSPQVAGSIVTVLIEYLCDVVFQVPFYSSAILSENRAYRAAKNALLENTKALDTLESAITSGDLSEDDAEKVGLLQHGRIAWNQLGSPSGSAPVLQSRLARQIVRRIGELDLESHESRASLAALITSLDLVDNHASDFQKEFTCHRTGVIREHIRCRHLNPGSHGECDRDKDTGSLEDGTKDYSDLIGAIVSFAATTADKNVRSLFGGAVRGVSLVSLDNEVLAEMLSSAAATLAKKTVEAVTYKWLNDFVTGNQGDADQKRDFLSLLGEIHGKLESD